MATNWISNIIGRTDVKIASLLALALGIYNFSNGSLVIVKSANSKADNIISKQTIVDGNEYTTFVDFRLLVKSNSFKRCRISSATIMGGNSYGEDCLPKIFFVDNINLSWYRTKQVSVYFSFREIIIKNTHDYPCPEFIIKLYDENNKPLKNDETGKDAVIFFSPPD